MRVSLNFGPHALAPGRWLRLVRSDASVARPRPRQTLLIVGNGMVGQRLCERLVALDAGKLYRILVVGEEELPAYDRVHLTDIWRGREPKDLLLRDVAWYREHGIELHLADRVDSIDRSARSVRTVTGATFVYDKLVFATGSSPVALRVPIEPGIEVLSYRTLSDSRSIFARAQTGRTLDKPVVVIGGGLLGIEAARSLQQLGCRVVVLEASSQLLPRQLDPEAAEVLAKVLRDAGIDLRLRAQIDGISKTSTGVRIELAAEDAVEGSFVVCAVGAKARDELARDIELRCHVRGGIAVDSAMKTPDPAIFAVGECASLEGVPHGLVAPGYAMAEVLAENLVGRRRRLGPQQAVTRLKLDLTEVTVLGDPIQTASAEDLVHRSEGHYRRLVVKNRRVIAAICVGPWAESSRVQSVIEAGQRLPRASLQRFVREGELGLISKTLPIAQWANATMVCQCAQVSCGALRSSMAAGATTPAALARVTAASTLCGSCRPLLEELCGAPAAAPARVDRGLAATAAVVLGLGSLTLLAPAVPAAASAVGDSVRTIWFDPFWKQTTGFTLGALILLAFALSARKRIKRLAFGAYAKWRVIHAVLGAAGAVALFAHTGFRLGSQLNLVLMLVFLASLLSGAASGVLVALAARGANTVLQRGIAITKRMHDFSFWALPVLVVFHVFKTYYY